LICNEKSSNLTNCERGILLSNEEVKTALNSPEIRKDRFVNLKYDIWFVNILFPNFEIIIVNLWLLTITTFNK